ncbi:T9SS type A sorting domain-containing protein [Gracilimonas mengyeensis]|uniref:Por secretion system C-terminal sorting domain-containing protein n=1 Tax=Gracilimonas mengyeensis TaxID=1302730 RepID=A0A521EJ55_9BACT|nr:T9SS type A sorting domain-containing protein [Gracilimonas mengyeensis]SMO83935.1 Por secretion system C-terminal sorting domain-containing protein [Gracilimonas mengyeensis]
MKKNLLLSISTVLLLAGLAMPVLAQEHISIKELNTYPEPLESATDVTNHPLADSVVTITAVIQSYPRSSGNRSYNSSDNSIGSIQVFVIDTAAASQGRAGMSMMINESFSDEMEELETLNRGDIVNLTGSLSFFFNGAQFGIAPDGISYVGNVNLDYPEYAGLLEPWEVDLTEINIANDDGTFQMNLDNYETYAHSYIKVSNGVISNVSLGSRVDYSVNADGTRIYGYDTSLRYRNDRPTYRTVEGTHDYNWRRAEDGDFEPPVGALANVSGFLTLSGDDPDGVLAPSAEELWSINPFEDGVLWRQNSAGEDIRLVDGENGFEWPNDFEITGLPPVATSFTATPDTSIVGSGVEVSFSLTAEGPVGDVGIDSVKVFYQAGTQDSSYVLDTSNNEEFTGSLPAFPEFTAVSYYFEIYSDDGLTGRYPTSGNEGFFVLDDAVNSIELVQRTTDGGIGASSLADKGVVPTDITATVAAGAADDGFIAIQDRAAKWSGIFVEIDDNTGILERGDRIQINELTVFENYGLTVATLNDFSVLDQANTQVDTLAVSVLTQDVTSIPGIEEYEGVFLSFSDVKVTTNQADGGSDYGEWEIGSRQGGDASVDTLEAGEGLRINDDFDFGSPDISSTLNEYVKVGAQIDEVKGFLQYSFGDPKLVLRSLEDITGDNWTYPRTDFSLESPSDNAEVTVTSDVEATWQASQDFDGNNVTYEWVLYSAADTTEIIAVTSDDEGAAAQATLPYETVDGLLENLGLNEGESEDFLWNVRISDGADTLAVSQGYEIETNSFTPLYYTLTLEKGGPVSNEMEGGIPQTYDLKQNYPNPFNPTTKITFDLPEATQVELHVYDMLGRRVATIMNDRMTAGTHSLNFDATRLASGMYVYQIKAGSFASTRKMMLIK